jgi:hypothetical protein
VTVLPLQAYFSTQIQHSKHSSSPFSSNPTLFFETKKASADHLLTLSLLFDSSPPLTSHNLPTIPFPSHLVSTLFHKVRITVSISGVHRKKRQLRKASKQAQPARLPSSVKKKRYKKKRFISTSGGVLIQLF